MSDGASMGIGAERALKTILRGEDPPAEEEGLSLEAMRKKIYAASLTPDSYDECGWACARIVCEYLEQHPEDIGLPSEDVYDWDRWRADAADDPELQNPSAAAIARMTEYRLAQGLYDRIKERDAERGVQLQKLGMTGFLWGWGYNAAHRVLGLPPGDNPALVTVTT